MMSRKQPLSIGYKQASCRHAGFCCGRRPDSEFAAETDIAGVLTPSAVAIAPDKRERGCGRKPMSETEADAVFTLKCRGAGLPGRFSRHRRHRRAGGGHRRGDTAPSLAVVVDDLGLQSTNLRLEAGGEALQLADIHSIGLADAGG